MKAPVKTPMKALMEATLKAILTSMIALTLVSCDSRNGVLVSTGALSPTLTPSISLQLIPLGLPIATASPLTCPLGQSFSIPLGLIVVSGGPSNFTMDRVTVRLLDGSSVGGPEVTVPQLGLDGTQGSTVVSGTNRFTLSPDFACVIGAPQTVEVNVSVFDASGRAKTLTASARLRP